jgi:hypothetical protein
MTCEEARVLLLEAEISELEVEIPDVDASTASPLAQHMRTCAKCAAAAGDIVRATRALDAHLSEVADAAGVDVVLARLGVPAGNAPEASGPDADRADGAAIPVTNTTDVRRVRPRRAAWSAVALAAAAAGLLFVTQGPWTRGPLIRGLGPRPAATPFTTVAAAPLPLVEDAGGDDVAILQTDDPDITVLWFF